MDTDTQIREAIRSALKARNWTQQQLADRLGISKSAVAQLLSGAYGKIPGSLQDALDALDLDLTAQLRGVVTDKTVSDDSGVPALDFLALMRRREEEFRHQHRKDIGLSAAATVLNFSCGYLYWLQRTINASITSPPAWDKVAALYLLGRALDDLRSALELAERGAPVQAMSLLSSVYEVEAALLEIGNDAAKGQLWMSQEGETGDVFSDRQNKHGQPIRKSIKERGKDFYSNAGVAGVTVEQLREAHEARYNELYVALCAYKHVQPSVQRQFGLIRTDDGLEVQPGPQWTPHVRQSVLATYDLAESLAEHVFLVAAKAHLSQPQETDATRFVHQMRSAWQKVLELEQSGEGKLGREG